MTEAVKHTLSGKRVFVGLSGGVDSSVSAALLKRSGANVHGVFIQGWYPEGLPCTWREDRQDAMKVAAHLEIPFHTLNAEDAYRTSVIEYLLREYKAGRTPNPDIMCNRDVKFGAFYTFAKKHGADYIATGHYAQTENGKLFRSKDTAKDQSYFLWAIDQTALSHTLFPVGHLEKSETRLLARSFALPVAEKKDSQGICFLGSISVEDFLKNEFTPHAGKAVSETGEEVGAHDGAVLYTLGERVALRNATQGPWYVVAKDMERNILTVSHTSKTSVANTTLTLEDVHFFRPLTKPTKLHAQYRYHGPLVSGVYDPHTSTFTAPNLEETPASGQSLVLYDGNECVGGGIIR